MAPKNKLVIKRAIIIFTPIVLIVAISCFFFIDIRWDEMNYEQWKSSIMTWILSYGGVLLLFTKAFLTALSARKVLSNKTAPLVQETINGVVQVSSNKKKCSKRNKNDIEQEPPSPIRIKSY